MTHEEAVALLPESLRGDHRDGVDPGWASHLATCEECRSLAVTYDTLSTALLQRKDVPRGEHPGSAEIVSHALAPGSPQGPESERVTAHLRQCGECESLVAATRGAHKEASTWAGPRLVTVVGPQARVGLAVAASLVLLVYPAFLGIVRLPEALRQVDRARAVEASARQEAYGLQASLDKAMTDLASATGWSGAVDLNVLEVPSRGPAEARVLRLGPGQPFLLVAVLPPPAAVAVLGEGRRFAIGRPGEAPLWSEDLTVAQLRELMKRSGVVTFAVPARLIPPGDYRIVVTRPDTEASGPLLEIPFAVARTK